MESNLRDAAIAHAPFFITAPGETDILFHVIVWFVVLAIFGLGALYLTLHALPEKLAHHANHTQIQLISILTLLALFTHNNVFWVAALVLAVIRFPDFMSPIQAMADSLKKIAQTKTGAGDTTAQAVVADTTVSANVTKQEG
jgi:fumarate reductase subunit C